MQTPILPTDYRYTTATYYIDLSAENLKSLLDKLQALHRDFEHFRQTIEQAIEAGEHGTSVASELQTIAEKYFGDDLAYLFDDTDFSTKFPELAAGAWSPETLAECCNGVVSINEPNASFNDYPTSFRIVPSNIFVNTTGAGLEYHTVFSFVLYFTGG